MKEIQRIVRYFLWTCFECGSRKAPIAWEHMCSSKSCGAWNLIDLITWNKTAVTKHY